MLKYIRYLRATAACKCWDLRCVLKLQHSNTHLWTWKSQVISLGMDRRNQDALLAKHCCLRTSNQSRGSEPEYGTSFSKYVTVLITCTENARNVMVVRQDNLPERMRGPNRIHYSWKFSEPIWLLNFGSRCTTTHFSSYAYVLPALRCMIWIMSSHFMKKNHLFIFGWWTTEGAW